MGVGQEIWKMAMAGVVLITSVALFMFYLQTLCEKVLKQEFAHSYSAFLVHTASLEFLEMRRKLVAAEGAIDYTRVATALECDYRVELNLLQQFNSKGLHHKVANLLLRCYFRLLSFSVSPSRALGFTGKAALLKLTDILQYFSNTVGQQMCLARAEALSTSSNM